MTPILRPAMLSDIPRLAEILHGWIQSTPWMPKLHRPHETFAFLRQLHETSEITVSGGAEIAGFLSLDGTEIPAFYVAAGARGNGQGAALLAAAQAARPRLALWCFQQNEGARRFYARHGFTETARTDGTRNEEKLPDLRLEWSRA